MNRFQQVLGKVCDNCPLCNYARKNPGTPFGKVMAWHGQYCPAWKAQKEISADRVIETRGNSDAETRREESTAE